VFSSCYSQRVTIITDSEEKRHGGTSQEVSQEVREQEGEQAQRIEATHEPHVIGKTLHEESASGETQRDEEKIRGQASGDQEARGEASRHEEERREEEHREAFHCAT
jgi:hypothetical protein